MDNTFHQSRGAGPTARRSGPARAALRLAAVLALASAALVLASRNAASAETWTDSSGKYTVQAEFITLRGNDVYLKKTNGVVIKVPLDRLSPESQALARRLAGPAPITDTPDGAVRAVMEGLQTGNVRVVWDALPPSYQNDVNDLIHTFAENMDPQLWNGVADIAKKIVRILKEKKQFILAYPKLAQSPVNKDALAENWDVAADVLDAIVNSELTDLQKLKTFDVGTFLDGSGKAIGEKIAAMAQAMKGQELATPNFPGMAVPVDAEKLADLRNAKFTTVKRQGDTATVRMEAGGKVQEEEFVRVEGKWLPKKMVDQWPDAIAKAKQAISSTMPNAIKEKKQQFVMPLMMINGLLAQVLATKTQEEFNQVIDGMIQTFQPKPPPGAGGGQGPRIEGGNVPAETPGGAANPFGPPRRKASPFSPST